MNRVLTRNQTVRFDDDVLGAGTPTPITLERGVDPVVFDNGDTNAISVRLFPNLLGVQYEASVGTIEDLSVIGILLREEFVQFSNTQFATLRYPVDKGVIAVDVKFAFTASGDKLDSDDLSFYAEKNEDKVIANRPFVGAVKISYASSYRILRYTPEAGQPFTPSGQVFFRNYGHVLAFLDQDRFAILEIEPPGLDLGELIQEKRRELYRVVSNVQVNNNGAWERHPNFDTGGNWGGAAPVDGDALFEYERVHEIGYISSFFKGDVSYETESFVQEQGPPGGFNAVYTANFKPAADFAGAFQDSYDRVKNRIPAVENDIRSRWFGITF